MTTVAAQLNINVFQYELGLDLIGMHQLKKFSKRSSQNNGSNIFWFNDTSGMNKHIESDHA
jgi:hypothetical protein